MRKQQEEKPLTPEELDAAEFDFLDQLADLGQSYYNARLDGNLELARSTYELTQSIRASGDT